MAESSAPLIDEADNRKPRETADDYAGTLVEFGGWRIVRCKHDIQWIVQKDREHPVMPPYRWPTVPVTLRSERNAKA